MDKSVTDLSMWDGVVITTACMADGRVTINATKDGVHAMRTVPPDKVAMAIESTLACMAGACMIRFDDEEDA